MDKLEISLALAEYCLKILKSQCAVVEHVGRDDAVALLRRKRDELGFAIASFEIAQKRADTGTEVTTK